MYKYFENMSWLVRGFFICGVLLLGLQTLLFALGYESDPDRREPGVVSIRGSGGRVGHGGWRFWSDGFSGGK